MRANGFKNVLNRYRVTLELTGSDGPAVKNKSGDIQASQGHYAARNGLVAADENDECIEEITARDKLDRISDHFTAHQRRTHALSTHGDAVRNGDGVELQGSAAGGANAVFHVLRQFAKVIVAGTNLDPGVGHADQGLAEILVAKAGSAKHGARGCAMRTVGKGVASRFGLRVAHERVLSPAIDCDRPAMGRPAKTPGDRTMDGMMSSRPSATIRLRKPAGYGNKSWNGTVYGDNQQYPPRK